ncbi:MAG: diguanylate [Geobacteraceae bacterium]|nr:MAG: diguanylate [Geobacteraceae bacterium]
MTKVRKEIKTKDTEPLERLVKERTEELERANERLFLANQVKAEFLAHMSKELRTPLNYIIDFANSLREGALGKINKGQKECLDAIAESSSRLRSVVDRILELCNIDIGMTRFLPRKFAVADALARTIDGVLELSKRQGIVIDTRYNEGLGSVTADENKFLFVMEELLTNALKFSRKGSKITITARETKITGDNGKRFLEISVADEGLGIRQEDMERIFLGFERGWGAPPENGSLALGLAVVKRFVELHGGRIWVDSYPGEGSIFTFILPKEGPLPPESATPKVMVADSDPNFVQMLSHYLKEEGYEIMVARNGLDVLEKGTAFSPDLFLLEVALSEMNGIDVCLRLKSHDGTRHVPVVMVASLSELAEKIKSIQVGADSFFTKPLDMNELLPKIKSLVTQKLNYDFLKKSYEIAEAEACTDSLTGLCNLRHLLVTLDRELERSRRYNRFCSLAMIDIDFFKNFNDRHGHLQGDEVLKQAAELFREHIRNSDIAARYGGEEFVVIMPETGKELAVLVGEKLRKAFEEFPFPLEETQPAGSLTISMGIATFPLDADSARWLLDVADKALYLAKESGRNRVVAWKG